MVFRVSLVFLVLHFTLYYHALGPFVQQKPQLITHEVYNLLKMHWSFSPLIVLWSNVAECHRTLFVFQFIVAEVKVGT